MASVNRPRTVRGFGAKTPRSKLVMLVQPGDGENSFTRKYFRKRKHFWYEPGALRKAAPSGFVFVWKAHSLPANEPRDDS